MPVGVLVVQIMRFVDDTQPGVVECEVVDANGQRHCFVDKVPIFSTELLDAHSGYPRNGVMACEVLARWKDASGKGLARVNTRRPDGVESSEGKSEFVFFGDQFVSLT